MVDTAPKNSNVVSLTARKQPPGLARMPDTVRRCQDKARLLLQPLVARMLDKVDDALFQLADKAASNIEQNLYFDAMRQVRVGRRGLEQSMTASVQAAFSKLYEARKETQDSTADLDSLSLVANDDLEELVAVDAMVNKASEVSAEAIAHLAMRLDNQIDFKIYEGNNPFAPRVICAGFVEAAKELTIDLKAKLVLFKYFDQQVASQLAGVYKSLNDLLIEAKVLPSLSAELKRARKAPAPQPPEDQGLQGPVVGQAMAGQVKIGEAMAGEVVAGTESSAESAITSSDLAQALPQLQGVLPSVSQATGQVQPNSQLASLLTQLQNSTAATGGQGTGTGVSLKSLVEQSLAKSGQQVRPLENDLINLVSMLFEFILEDRSLAPAMKSLLARLQIPFLKLALVDREFFSRSGHPARRLLNEMATAALGWQAPEPELGAKPDRLYRKISEIVEQVVAEFDRDSQIFTRLLEDFLSFSDKEKRRAKVLEQRMLDAEQGKAKSEQAREQVQVALAPLMAGQDLPAVVCTLLEKAWANVLMMTTLKGADQSIWQSQLVTAEDLIWSVSAPLDREGRGKLIGLLPDLLSRLRKGLEGIAYNPYELSQLFEQLEKVHLERLRAPLEVPKSSEEADVESEGESELPKDHKDHKDQEVLEVEPETDEAEELDAPVKQSTVDSLQPPESPDVTGVELSSQEIPVNAGADMGPFLAQVDRLAQGSWFEMDSQEQVYRCRLAAIIKGADKYVFINRAGAKVAQKSRDQLAEALRSGELKMLDDSMLFDRALENVIGSLRSQRGL